MSLLIKGMDIPEQLPDLTDTNAITIYNCQIFIDSKGNASIRIRGHREEYPIVKILTPHGRLIDADRLIEYINKELKGDEYIQRMFRRIVKSRPTVIKAEGVNE